jgi:hypothetical protein
VTTRYRRAITLTAVLAIAALGVVYQAKGFHDLIWGSDVTSAVDLLNRDVEHRFFVRGENPFDHVEASQPPWGYPFGLVLTWPEWPAVRVYFAVLNALALALLLFWIYRYARGAPREIRLLLMVSVLAFGGACTATEVGQVSIIVTALLAGALLCDEHDHPYLCGLLVALALIKPTMSAPFAIALVMTGRYRAALTTAAYAVAAVGFTWWVTGASPIHMLDQLAAGAARYVRDGTYGVMDLLAAMDVAASTQVLITPLIVAVPGVLLTLLVRRSLPLAFAVAAVWGRLWTYHKTYDDVMLALLLVPIGLIAFTGKSRASLVAFWLLAVLLWLPGRVVVFERVQMLQLIAWPLALGLLMVVSRRGEPAALAHSPAPPVRSGLVTT